MEGKRRTVIRMKVPRTNNKLPDAWKIKFASMQPMIPAMFHILPPVVVIMIGCFGEPSFATPWSAISMFLVSGISFLLLLRKKQTVIWEKWTFFTVRLSMFVAFLATALNVLQFVVTSLQNPPHPGLSYPELIHRYNVNTAELTLGVLEIRICSWILRILEETRKTLVNKKKTAGQAAYLAIKGHSTKKQRNKKPEKVVRPQGYLLILHQE